MAQNDRLIPVVLLALVTATLFGGCRPPAGLVQQQRNAGTVYDTAHEKLLGGERSLPLLEQAWRSEVPIYAEPVAIRRWRDGVSTWDVYFAANRGADPQVADGSAARFGDAVLKTPRFGLAHVTLPRRRRGIDPRRASAAVAHAGDDSADLERPQDCASLDLVSELPEEAFLAGVSAQVKRSRQRDVLLFVHGFNVDFESCLIRTAQVALDMPFNGAVAAFSWPSKGGVANYGEDERRNAASVEPFSQFLGQLRDQLPDDVRLHIVVHSMGNRIVLHALSQLPEPDGLPPVDNLALFAPDVGLGDFQRWAPAACRQCRRVTLYASRHDAALIASKGLHAEQRAGDAFPPVILDAVDTVDCSSIDGTDFLGHSYYSSNVDVLADLFQVIKRDRSAAQRGHLTAKSTSGGKFWRWTSTAPHDIWTWHFDDPAESHVGDSTLR